VNSFHPGVHVYFRERGALEMYVVTVKTRIICDWHGGMSSTEPANRFIFYWLPVLKLFDGNLA
jgi:hypothetical protein